MSGSDNSNRREEFHRIPTEGEGIRSAFRLDGESAEDFEFQWKDQRGCAERTGFKVGI